MTISDPFAPRPQAGVLADPFAGNGQPYIDPNRPPRTEDLIPRHPSKTDGRPGIWLPDGSQRRWYSRPSSWGKKVEDTTLLSKWETRVTVDGFLSHGALSDAIQLEWAGTGPEDKDKRNALCTTAKGYDQTADRVGTGVHVLTERYDHGYDVNPPAKHRADLEEWKRLTRFFEVVQMPSGAPGIECFVAFDQLRPPKIDLSGGEREVYPIIRYDGSHWSHWVRLAGTFDRLWKYKPCPKCGRRNYIGDLKTGQPKEWNEASYSVQEAIYSRGKEYIPHADGNGADRFDLPDVCQHVAIVVYLPSGTGRGLVKWVNIAKAYDVAVGLIPDVTEHRRQKNWMVEFTPVPDMWAEVENATSVTEIKALWRQYPDAFTSDLIEMAGERMKTLPQ